MLLFSFILAIIFIVAVVTGLRRADERIRSAAETHREREQMCEYLRGLPDPEPEDPVIELDTRHLN